MDVGALKVLTVKELRDALRTRWFVYYTLAFTALAAGLGYLATSSAGYGAMQGYGRAGAGLVNLVLLVVPLMGLTAGAQAIAGERERGTLGYLLTQPVTRAEIYVGKFLGLALALLVAVAVSFGVTAVALGSGGLPIDAGPYAGFVGLTLLLALASLGLGCLVSTLSQRTAAALGVTMAIWLGLVFLGDLGLMGMSLVVPLGIRGLFWFSLLNPLQVFKVAAVAVLQPAMDVLGPVGLYATDFLGNGLTLTFVGLLFLWALVPAGLALALFVRRDGE